MNTKRYSYGSFWKKYVTIFSSKNLQNVLVVLPFHVKLTCMVVIRYNRFWLTSHPQLCLLSQTIAIIIDH